MRNILKNQKTVMVIIPIVVVMICVVVLIAVKLFNGAGNVVTKYAQGMMEFDSEKIVSLYDDKMVSESYDSIEDMVKDYDEMFKYLKEDYYKINNYVIDSKYNKLEGKDFNSKLNELVEHYKYKKRDVEEIRLYKVTFECDVDGSIKEVEHNIFVSKIKGEWFYIGNDS